MSETRLTLRRFTGRPCPYGEPDRADLAEVLRYNHASWPQVLQSGQPISCVMASQPLPAAFAYLVDENNLAVDAALVEVLPHLEPFVQAAALEILLERDHPPSLAAVAGRFNDHNDVLQRLICARAGELSAGVRLAMASSTLQERASAIEMTVRSDTGQLAYLLADAVRSRCRRTRELAAAGFHRMTARLMHRLEADPTAEEIADLDVRANCLAEALATAVQRWEIHFQPKVLEAALWLGDRVEPAIKNKLRGRRTKIARILNDMLEGTSDPRLAGFLLRALAVPELRPAAARAISRARDGTLLRAMFMESWLLADAGIERGCRWIHDDQWLQQAVNVLFELDGSTLGGAIRFLAAVGGPHQQKIEFFRKLIGAGRAEIRRATVWHLVHDKSEVATSLLSIVATRPTDSIARMAAREVRHRRSGAGFTVGTHQSAPESISETTLHDAFDRYWNQFDDFSPKERLEAGNAIGPYVPDLGTLLRGKLASGEPLDRARTLRMVCSLGLLTELEESVRHLAHDPDPIVRSLAVSMLAELPGPTTERVLRAAVNDPDERVQANAIEALDRLNVEDRVVCTEPRLSSPDNRVRANAVKSLLRMELRRAGEVLLDMLEDPSPASRLSALWVIERMQSQTALSRVGDMSRSDSDERVRSRAKRVRDVIAPERTTHLPSFEAASKEA